jgi:2-polyprenyl-3-methyl-5-hydroxy-6-metoxy-1,4-benzoquinol methylase
MTPELVQYLCDPVSKEPLSLIASQVESHGLIVSGTLKSPSGDLYPIVGGIPRFIPSNHLRHSVESFGNEWNYFNFTDFKAHWLRHTVANTFGSTDVFSGKVIVDAGGGSGAQTLWMLESGAKHVIMLELSRSVDDVVRRNLEPSGLTNYDVIQCSIDAPPLREQSIEGMVICHNVIQHTASVERTAHALFALVAPGGEFVFNCYRLNDEGLLRWLRFHLVYRMLRKMLSRLPFNALLTYARIMGILRCIPGVGWMLEKAGLCVRGDIPALHGERVWHRLWHSYKATILNTFDGFGSHHYQHHKRDAEIKQLATTLQPDASKVLNADKYFRRPPPIGCALRLFR